MRNKNRVTPESIRRHRRAEIQRLESTTTRTPSQASLLRRLRRMETTDPIAARERALREQLGLAPPN